MRKLIVTFVVLAIFIAVPLVAVLAADPESGPGTIAKIVTKVATFGSLVILGTIVGVYVNLLGLLALQMVHALVKLAAYNDFINFAPVVQAWTIVRDVVNMSFVIVLLVIAISTILNIEAYSYRRLLPKLVIMAVLINFSRTIAGLIIDAGQVVMLTFVNAFAGAAGGNFINALHVNDLLSFGLSSTVFTLNVDPGTILASYILAAVAITVTFIVMLTFVGILLFRVLTLWFLIVLSPLAFAVAAWPSSKANKYYGEWWSKFTDNVISGPILAFFLWLALMMMGADFVTQLTPGLSATGDAASKIPQAAAVTQLSAPETFVSFLFGIGTLLMVLKMVQSMQVGFASFGTQALEFAKKQGTVAAKLLGKGALLTTGAGANLAARGIDTVRGKEYQGTIQERGYSILANVPGFRNLALGQLGKSRADRAKLMAPQNEILSKLNLQEQDKVLARHLPTAILTPDMAATRAGQLFFAVTDKNRAREKEAQYRKQLEPQYGKEEAAEKAKEMVRKETAGYMKEFNEVAKVAAAPEITRKAIEMKNTRPDLLEGSEFVDHVERMDPEDIKKLTPASFEGVIDRPEMPADTRFRFLEAAEKGSFGLQKVAKEKRDAFAKKAAEKGGEEQEKFWKQEEAAFRTKKYDDRLRDQDIGEDDVANPRIAKLLVTDNNYSTELDNILRKNDDRTEALQKTLDSLQRTLAAKPDGGVMEQDGKKVYNPEMLVLSENMVRAGGSLDKAYRLDKDKAKFTDEAGRNSFANSLQGKNKIDIMLKTPGNILRVKNYNNDVAISVINAISPEDLGDLVVKAGKDPKARQNLSDIAEAVKNLSKTNTNAAKLLDEIKNNSVLYSSLHKQVIGKKGPGGGTPSTPAGDEGPEDEVTDEGEES